MKNAHIHRFRDKAAISLPGKGGTVYLTEKEARAIAKALNACARNIKEQPLFSLSSFGASTVPLSDPIRDN